MKTWTWTQRRFIVNGQEYDSLEAMPPDVRREWDSMMAHAERLSAGGPRASNSPWRTASGLQRVAMSAFVIGISLVVWEIFRKGFFASPQYVRVVWFPAAVLAIVLTVSLLGIRQLRAERPRSFFSRDFIFGPTVAIFITIAILWAVADLLNIVAGREFRDVYVVSHTKYESRRGVVCRHVYLRELEDHWFGELCVSEQAFNALRAGQRLDMTGKRSWFGVKLKIYGD